MMGYSADKFAIRMSPEPSRLGTLLL